MKTKLDPRNVSNKRFAKAIAFAIRKKEKYVKFGHLLVPLEKEEK